MKPVVSDWTTVVVGNWNLAILNPTWIAGEVLEVAEVEVEALIGPSIPDFRYSSGALKILPRPDRIVVSPGSSDDAALERCQAIVLKLLELLPRTPISSVGINFGYIETEPSQELGSIFDLQDNDGISDAALQIRSTSVTRAIEYETWMLNYKISLDPEHHVAFHFNFHKDIGDAAAAAVEIRDKAVAFKMAAEQMLNAIYDLELEQANG